MTDPKILTPAEVAEIKARLEDADVIYFDSIPALCHTIEELRAGLREIAHLVNPKLERLSGDLLESEINRIINPLLGDPT